MRKTFVQIHTILIGMMFPLLILFMITGLFYMLDFKGGTTSQNEYTFLEETNSIDYVINKTSKILKNNGYNIDLKNGLSLYEIGSGLMLSKHGLNSSVEIKKHNNNVQITVTENDLLRKLINLHKAKGSIVFKTYTYLLVALMLMLLWNFYVL